MPALWKTMCISIVIAGLLAMGGCSASLSPTATPTGRLEGITSDASTGSPMSGTQVTIAGQVGVFAVTTDSDGKYKVADLPAGAYLVSVQAAGYYVNAAQVGVVANVVSSGDIALEPAVVVVATATPTHTPMPTPTVLPSATPTSTVVPSPTPRQTPAPTRQVSTGARPKSTYMAPVLVEPRDGSVFVGPKRITFRWEGSCCMAADEYYVVSIPHLQGVEEAWVKTMAWEAPDYLYLLAPESRQLTWNVSVRRHTGEYPNGQWKGPIVSPISETWHFVWPTGEGRPVSPLPTPGQ